MPQTIRRESASGERWEKAGTKLDYVIAHADRSTREIQIDTYIAGSYICVRR